MSSKAKSIVVLVVVVSLELAACAGLQPTPTPTEPQTVMLRELPGSTDVAIHKERTAWYEVVARLPPGTECNLLGKETVTEAFMTQMVTIYKIDCNGTVGFVYEESLIFPRETPSP